MKKKELDKQLELMKKVQKNEIVQSLFTHGVYEYNGNVVWFKEKETSDLPYYSNSMHEVLKYDIYVNNKRVSSLEKVDENVDNNLAELIKEYYYEYSDIEIKILNLAPPVLLFKIINMVKLGTINGRLVLYTIIKKLEPKFWQVKTHNTHKVLKEIEEW